MPRNIKEIERELENIIRKLSDVFGGEFTIETIKAACPHCKEFHPVTGKVRKLYGWCPITEKRFEIDVRTLGGYEGEA